MNSISRRHAPLIFDSVRVQNVQKCAALAWWSVTLVWFGNFFGIYWFLFDGIEKVLKSHMYIIGRGYCLQPPEASCVNYLPVIHCCLYMMYWKNIVYVFLILKKINPFFCVNIDYLLSGHQYRFILIKLPQFTIDI